MGMLLHTESSPTDAILLNPDLNSELVLYHMIKIQNLLN